MSCTTNEDPQDPIFQKYQLFKEQTLKDMLMKISALVKSVNPEIAVSTYHYIGVDMIRSESNSAVDRPYPFWLYSGSLNVARVEGSFPDKVSSNCVINAVDIPYRFMGVSKYLTQIRLLESMAQGAGLDWCIIGSFADYPDQANFESVRQVFRFRAAHETYYAHIQSCARILLVNPGMQYNNAANEEFLGLYKMLKEDHRPFCVIDQYALEAAPKLMDHYDCVILPDFIPGETVKFQEVLEQTSARVITAGQSFQACADILKSIFGLVEASVIQDTRGQLRGCQPQGNFQGFRSKRLGLPGWKLLPGDSRTGC